MYSLIIIIAQLILKDYKELRIGMLISSLIFILLCITFIISIFNYKNAILVSFISIIVYMLFENYIMPKLWNSKKLLK